MKHLFVILAYKESEYLETCIRSVLSQRATIDVIIATSTLNEWIQNIANKYNLKVYQTIHGLGIGHDFDFALFADNADLVTIAHQDDIYNEEYAISIQEAYQSQPNALILYTDYYEIRNEQKVQNNVNLVIKRLLQLGLKIKALQSFRLIKRITLSFGNPIACPAITYRQALMPKPLFDQIPGLQNNVDWQALEILSRKEGAFVFISKALMGHRIHAQSTTSHIILQNKRTQEDRLILQRFWPKFIANSIAWIYQLSERSNRAND